MFALNSITIVTALQEPIGYMVNDWVNLLGYEEEEDHWN